MGILQGGMSGRTNITILGCGYVADMYRLTLHGEIAFTGASGRDCSWSDMIGLTALKALLAEANTLVLPPFAEGCDRVANGMRDGFRPGKERS